MTHAHTKLVGQVRGLLRSGARQRADWLRTNLRTAMTAADLDLVTLSALSGVSPGTIRGFMAGTDSSVTTVLQLAMALGLSLGELERPPDDFRVSAGETDAQE